jgi:hypothetical protein
MIRVYHSKFDCREYDSRCVGVHCIKAATRAARKKGVPNYKLKEWIKRKVECIHVVRMTKDGSIGCSTPCLLCRKLIISFDLRVVCTTGRSVQGQDDGQRSTCFKLTSGQAAKFKACNANRCCKHGVEKTIFYHTKSMWHVVPRFCPWDGKHTVSQHGWGLRIR